MDKDSQEPEKQGPDSQEPDSQERRGSQETPLKKKSDEGWKEKARLEKERLAGEAGPGRPSLPPPDLDALVQELSLRAMLALGQLRHPATGDVYFDLEAAKYAIDLLGVLEEKTKGNLEPGEKADLEDALHTLRLIYVQAARHPPGPADLAPESGEGAPGPGAAFGGTPGGLEQGPDPSKPGPKIIY